MKFLDTITVDSHFRTRVAKVVDNLGGVRVAATPRWDRFVGQLEISERTDLDAPVLILGSPAVVLGHTSRATVGFGFVSPVAKLAKPWQRALTWRDDTTLDLWTMGWSPITVDRLIVATGTAPVEFVIATVRPTPSNASERAGAAGDVEAE